ncbi:MAG TPA: DUF4175 family protein, partial [Gemmatimonadales bacterium]|nr:DUF4175 family protein [Gemmatimonadales bacterium]
VRLDSAGRATRVVGPLQADLFARLTSGGRSSDTLRVAVRLPVLIGALSITARYPRYLGLDDEPLSTAGDTLFLPAGTRLEIRGEATAPLRTAAWRAGTTFAPMEVAATRFSGVLTPRVSGSFRLEAVAADGAVVGGDSVVLPIRVVPDSAPRVEVPVPGVDTTAPLSLRLPLVIDVRDDHGVERVAVESRRISRLGFADPVRVESVPVPAGRPDRAVLTFELDLRRRGLLPGDTVRYVVRASDNAPRPNVGRSREFVLRLPTLSEVRAAAREATASVGARLDSIAGESRRLERQTEDLARERPRGGERERRGGRGEEPLAFEAAKRAEAVAQTQEEMLRQAEALTEAIEALQRSAEAAGVNDPDWQRQLEEIRRQLDRAIPPELRERLAELQRALEELDAERTRDALEGLAKAQKELREALERSKELFRRAAIEGDLANLTAESRDLARQQAEWNQQAPAADSTRLAAQERELAARADSLAAALQRLGEELEPDGRKEPLRAAAARAEQAAQQMRQAAQSIQRGQRRSAREQGQRAAQNLQPLGDQLERQRQELQQEWRSEVTEAMDQALSETSRLAERQLSVEEAFRRGDVAGGRTEQAAVDEGVTRLLERLREAAGKNALVSPQIGAALAMAQQQMRRAREAVSSAMPSPREAAEQAGQAVDALNAAAYQMLRNRDELSGSGSGSGLAEALERMSRLAQQQEGVNGQAGGLLPMAGNPAAVRAQLQQLAGRQRAIAQELEKLRGGGQMSGAGQMAEEARDLARRMEAGRLDRQMVERQERLFRRMLDAGRTLQGREEDEKQERRSTTATDDSVRLPPELRARLGGDGGRLRMPSWEQLQHFTAEERRLVVEYFRRLAETPAGRGGEER